ncbi:hypothetical protein [uncultured Tateyamaria sp.]|uniref:hypothetical protein n=1 Tax=uncultured Tateyamaria sp. TaxID=455651 RepID=UPI0026207D8F|nr:hypothetical protein [uncultured Tateyamaria sp.]
MLVRLEGIELRRPGPRKNSIKPPLGWQKQFIDKCALEQRGRVWPVLRVDWQTFRNGSREEKRFFLPTAIYRNGTLAIEIANVDQIDYGRDQTLRPSCLRRLRFFEDFAWPLAGLDQAYLPRLLKHSDLIGLKIDLSAKDIARFKLSKTGRPAYHPTSYRRQKTSAKVRSRPLGRRIG